TGASGLPGICGSRRPRRVQVIHLRGSTIMSTPRRKVRYAVVGLGWFAQAAALPAFANARDNSELVALGTGGNEKARELGKRYDVPVVGYDGFEAFLASGGADAVYVVTPNGKHREHAEKAAGAGVHVLCEKPMAYTTDDCQAMIDACAAANVRLMIA